MATKLHQPSREEAQKEVDRNFAAFSEMEFNNRYKGKVALLHQGRLIKILDTKADAYKMGLSMYKYPGLFSVQEIAAPIVDLGIMSCGLRSA